MILCDTAPLFCSVDKSQPRHQAVKILIENESSIEEKDYPRLLSLMEKYKDRPMDLADATLVVTAENLKIKRILTFDSDFFSVSII